MKEKVLKIVAQVLKCNVDINSSQLNCQNWDSIHHLDLIVELEIEFGISFEPTEIVSIKSIKDILEIVSVKLK